MEKNGRNPQIHPRIPADVLKSVKTLQALTGQSQSDIVTEALRMYTKAVRHINTVYTTKKK